MVPGRGPAARNGLPRSTTHPGLHSPIRFFLTPGARIRATLPHVKPRQIRTRVLRTKDEDPDADVRCLTPAERLAMVWQITMDAWAFAGDTGAESRLQRDVVRVLRAAR